MTQLTVLTGLLITILPIVFLVALISVLILPPRLSGHHNLASFAVPPVDGEPVI